MLYKFYDFGCLKKALCKSQRTEGGYFQLSESNRKRSLTFVIKSSFVVSVRPDFRIKVAKYFANLTQRVAKAVFTWKESVFKNSQKVNKHLGYFCLKGYNPDIPKLAQSGHTAPDVVLIRQNILRPKYIRHILVDD